MNQRELMKAAMLRQLTERIPFLEVKFRPQTIYYPDLSGLSGERGPPLEKYRYFPLALQP